MKADKIHISHFNFITIENLKIDRAIGEHATVRLRGCIHDKDAESYKRLALEKLWVKITAEDEGGETEILMTGVIAGFSLERQQHVSILELVLKSGTYLMDGEVHFRSFQNKGMTYIDVLKTINKHYDDSGVIAENGMETSVDFLLQYKESDWEFVKRIASRFGLKVTPAVGREGAFYYVGNSHYATYTLPLSADCYASKRIGAFMRHGANGIGTLQEQDYIEYQVSSREIYDLWDFLVAGEQRGHICRICSEYRRGELIHTYWLRPAGSLREVRIFNGCQAGCSFQAEVKAVMQDKVQVALMGDENSGQEITRWFSYSTGYSSPDGAGWYCMPEVGDRVRLQIPDHMEEHGYVISAVHMDTDKGRKVPDHKSFRTRYGKELLFTPDSLELTNNQGMSVKIMDGEGIQIMSDRDISIIAGGTMTISSEASSLIIAGTESVDVRQGGAGLHMDSDIIFTGGKFRIQ